ncbi:uncharacterized protein [Anabrus simplex]|uniref:uncharacterized protein n=1 Tax=Anabrus simplex TaxID=316456 RepID=UPI0035A363D1
MEFTEQLASIQGALISLQKREGILKELSVSNADHIPKIHKVVQTLKDIICVESKKVENEDSLRKCTLFLILNTDLEAQEWLKDDSNCGHLVDCSPALSKDLLLEIVYELSLLKYMCEAVILCPAFLSSELLEIAIAKSATSPPSSTMYTCAEFAKAVYIKLIAFIINGYDNFADMLEYIQSKFLSHYEKCINNVIHPPALKLPGMTQTLMYDQAGVLLTNMLSFINGCLEYYVKYKGPSEIYSSDTLDIYSIAVDYDYTDWKMSEESNEKFLMNSLHDKLFEAGIETVSCITCDLWMYFAECDSSFGGERSLQNDLAEAMYNCLENINAVKARGIDSSRCKDLITMLTSMAVKPRDEDDEIKEADLSIILKNVSSKDKTQKKWFKALFKFNELITNRECIHCIQNNMQFVDYEEVDIILKRTISHLAIAKENETYDSLKLLALDCLQKLPLRSQLEIMNICLTKYSISPILCTEGFTAEMTETFNKAVNIEKKMDEKFYSDFIRLGLQNPKEVMRKVIVEAVTSIQQCSLMVNILKTLWPLKVLPVQQLSDGTVLPAGADEMLEDANIWSLVISSLYQVIVEHEWTDSEQENCLRLVAALVNESVIDGDKFLNLCLLPSLHSHLLVKNWQSVSLWLLILQTFVDGTVEQKSGMNEAAILVMLAHTMETSQTTFFTFSSKALSVYEQALRLVEIVAAQFLEGICVKDRTMMWLQEELLTITSPRTVLYFRALWNSCGDEVPVHPDLEVKLVHLGNMKVSEEGRREIYSKADFLTALIRLLPNSTSKEWNTIIHNMSLLVYDLPLNMTTASFTFTHLAEAIVLLCHSVTAGRDLTDSERECATSCLDHCVRNFALIIKEVIKRNGLSPSRGSLMFQKCIQVHEKMPALIKESCSGIILNILMDIISGMQGTLQPEVKESDPVMKELLINITKISDVGMKQILARKLLEVVG